MLAKFKKLKEASYILSVMPMLITHANSVEHNQSSRKCALMCFYLLILKVVGLILRTPLHARRHTHVHISECSELFPPAASGFASISMRKPPDHMAHGGLTGTPVVTEGLFDGSLWVFVSTFRQPPAPFLSEQLPTTQVFFIRSRRV